MAAPARRRHRRVRTEAAPGSDPAPGSAGGGDRREPGAPERPDVNDARLREDVPPHY